MPWPTLTNAEATSIITSKPLTVVSEARAPSPAPARRGGGIIISAKISGGGKGGLYVAEGSSVVADGMVSEDNFGPGIVIAPGARVTSRRGTYRRNVGSEIDNRGTFDSTDDQIG
ncbi:MAG: hypothetical protein ABR992_20400 [Solirubrobacteraceae bacterium]